MHRLNGICLLIHPTSSVGEIVSHMTVARCGAIFTCQTLVSSAVEVAAQMSVPQSKIFTLLLPDGFLKNAEPIDAFKNVEDLVSEGSRTMALEPLNWEKGQAKEQIAYLCATSGTSGKQVGLPFHVAPRRAHSYPQKLAMITHYGIIVNILQISALEKVHEASWVPQPVTGVVPFTHGYGVEIGHLTAWRGETLVVLPRFDMQLMLQSVQQHRIQRLYLVCHPVAGRRGAWVWTVADESAGAPHHRRAGNESFLFRGI